MTTRLTCERGHRWERPAGDTIPITLLACPVCGADVKSAASEAATFPSADPSEWNTRPPGSSLYQTAAMPVPVEAAGSNTRPHVHDSAPGPARETLTVPGYEILRVLGRGGMGVVYLA